MNVPMDGMGVGFLNDLEVVLSTDGDIFMRANFFSCADWVTLWDEEVEKKVG